MWLGARFVVLVIRFFQGTSNNMKEKGTPDIRESFNEAFWGNKDGLSWFLKQAFIIIICIIIICVIWFILYVSNNSN